MKKKKLLGMNSQLEITNAQLHQRVLELEQAAPEDELVRMKPRKPGVKLGELEVKVLADNAQLLAEIRQLRQRVQELESEKNKPLVDIDKVLVENEQLRQRIRQAAIYFQQLETQIDQSLVLTIVAGVELEQV